MNITLHKDTATMQDPPAPSHPAGLIPELREWNEGIEPLDWIGCVGSLQLAIGYSLLFWPEFVAFGRYVLRPGISEESVRSWEKSTRGDRRKIEAVLNHIHLAEIHRATQTPTEMQLRYLGRVLKEIYEAKLKMDFPDRRFEVWLLDEPGLDLIDYQLSFWQLDEPE